MRRPSDAMPRRASPSLKRSAIQRSKRSRVRRASAALRARSRKALKISLARSVVDGFPRAEMIAAGEEHQRETVAVIALRYFGYEQGVVADVDRPRPLAGEKRDAVRQSRQALHDFVFGMRLARPAREMARQALGLFRQHVD